MLKGIRNLIFDLGGVIIDLDTDQLIKRLSKLTSISYDTFKSRTFHNVEFRDYEKGLISDDEFRDHIRSLTSNSLSGKNIDENWNSILLDIPQQRLDLLARLKESYNMLLLSNTNSIHLSAVHEKLEVKGYKGFEPFFHREYYSHLLKQRKPDEKIYDIVLQDSGIMPNETLFLDDNIENLRGAEKLGIKTFHVKHPDLVLALFDER